MVDAPESAFVPTGGLVIEDGVVRWADRAFPLLFIALGAVAVASLWLVPAERSPLIASGLVLVAISPWILSLLGRPPIDPVFVATVLVPVGIITVFGEDWELVDLDGGAAQLVLMLVIGITGQIGFVAGRRKTVVVTVAALTLVGAGAISRGDPLDFAPWVVGVLLGAGGGRATQVSMRRLADLQVAEAELADQRLAEERRRIAREVHDIVAHTLSVTMLHLTAARLAVRSDPDAAESALEEAERNGRASMDDIRQVVRLLRSDDPESLTALPDDADLDELIDRFRNAGTDVVFDRRAALVAVPGPVRLATYRIVQESLSNAARHGAGPANVVVDTEAGTVVVRVDNPAADARTGHGAGVDGIRERVEALGGAFSAGPTGDGRWLVDARMPV